MASEFAKGYDWNQAIGGCFNEGDPVSLNEWKDLTDEQKAEVIRLRIGGKTRCYELSTLMGQYANGQFFDPETRIPWSAYQKDRIREALDAKYRVSERIRADAERQANTRQEAVTEGTEEEEEIPPFLSDEAFQCACVTICEKRGVRKRCPRISSRGGQSRMCTRSCICKPASQSMMATI